MFRRLVGRLGLSNSGGGARSLLTINDLQWQGYASVPAASTGPSDSNGGSAALGGFALAVRYVGGQRRYLMPHLTNSVATGRVWGDLVEYRDAASSYTGSDLTAAPELIETRRWHGATWTNFDSTPSWANGTNAANGARLGFLYWDDTHSVLWYTIYGYYSGVNQPFLGAVQLLDTTLSGTTPPTLYCNVGNYYGPWWYRSSAFGDLYWKQVNMYGAYPIPASAQAYMGGSKLLLGGGVGASHTQGHWGPGLQTLPDWPALTDPADTVLPLDRQLANYDQAESPITPVVNARRASDYSCFNYADHYLATTFPEGGYWNGSLDRLAGCAWVETATKHGLVYFGVKATGRSTYGDNPISITAMAIDTLTRSGTTATLTMVSDHGSTVPFSTGTSVTITNASPAGWNGTYVVTKTGATTFTFTCDGSLTTPAGRFDTSISIYAQGWDTNVLADLRDPSIGTPNSNHGYKSESFEGVVYAFDPAQLIDVSQGRRSKYSDGINPSLLGNWNTHWPNLPPWQGLDIGSTTNASQTRLVADNVSNRVFWDSTAQELIWVQPQSATSGGSRATVNRFTIAS